MNGSRSKWILQEATQAHVPELARMAAARIRNQRKAVPVLPSTHETAESLEPQLSGLIGNSPCQMVMEGGRPVGFLSGWRIPEFLGDRNGVFIPEVGFGTDTLEPERVIRIFRVLYEAMSARWCAEGWVNHAMQTFQEERALREQLFYGGFGGVCIDAIRPAVPLNLPVPSEVRIREVKAEDSAGMHAWLALANEHAEYMRAAPVFLGSCEHHGMAELEGWIGNPGCSVWVAEREADGLSFAYLQLETSTDGTSLLVHDERNLAVTGAFTKPEHRGSGVATLLLDAALKRAAEKGMSSVSVDFESRNAPAVAFWTRHFTPFTMSVLRQVDGRVFL